MQPRTSENKNTEKPNLQKPLRNCDVFGSFSVDDLEAARTFYTNTLGLEVDNQGDMGFSLRLGDASFFVYPKDDHRPATFTVLNFEVKDIEKSVEALKNSGVKFKSYEGDIKTDENNIHRDSEGPVIAWFSDPCGNILALIEEQSIQH